MAKYPWLAEYMKGPGGAQSPGSAHDQAASSSTAGSLESPSLDEDALLAAAWENLAARRHEWRAGPAPEGDDFETIYKTDHKTWGSTDKLYDSWVGQAKPGQASQWCKLFELPRMTSYSVNLHGQTVSLALAEEWCRRMQHYFDLWQTEPDGYVYTRADKAAYAPSQAWMDLVHSLPSAGKTRERVVAIEALFPGSPA